MQKIFLMYLTDTYGGELNYSWVTKLQVKATTLRGAVGKVARLTGLNFRHDYNGTYRSKSGATALVFDGNHNDEASYDYIGAELV
jgi:hypothetical protein